MGFWPIAGLAISFLILVSLLLWLVVDRKGSKVVKILTISFVLWYGILLYYTPQKMMGWPTTDNLPDYAVLLSWKVIEPSINPKEAGIYLWMVPKRIGETEEDFFKFLFIDPRHAFVITLENIPRAYKLPYSKGEHKALGDAERKARNLKGLILFWGKKKKRIGESGEREDLKDEDRYQVLNPRKILRKE